MESEVCQGYLTSDITLCFEPSQNVSGFYQVSLVTNHLHTPICVFNVTLPPYAELLHIITHTLYPGYKYSENASVAADYSHATVFKEIPPQMLPQAVESLLHSAGSFGKLSKEQNFL
jgi:hypothetical protein